MLTGTGPRRHEGDQCLVPHLPEGNRLGQRLSAAQVSRARRGLHQLQ
ncbi:hypothetical protein [Streptomyces sp. Ag109_O5-10]|nr:hypothetical protein [Streptomyces sp. Ag109_O5-10]